MNIKVLIIFLIASAAVQKSTSEKRHLDKRNREHCLKCLFNKSTVYVLKSNSTTTRAGDCVWIWTLAASERGNEMMFQSMCNSSGCKKSVDFSIKTKLNWTDCKITGSKRIKNIGLWSLYGPYKNLGMRDLWFLTAEKYNLTLPNQSKDEGDWPAIYRKFPLQITSQYFIK